MKPRTIIDCFYKNSAEKICAQIYESLSDNDDNNIATWKKTIFNIKLNSDISTSSIEDDFYDTLDKVARCIIVDREKYNADFCGYYQDSKEVDWDDIVDTIKIKLEKGLWTCRDNDVDRNNFIEKIQRMLRKKMTIEHIAGLIYYKLLHQFYDKGLYRTFQELLVENVGKQNCDIFTTSYWKAIKKIYQETVSIAFEDVYMKYYGKENLKSQYKPSFREIQGLITNDTPFYMQMVNKPNKCKPYPIQLWYLRMPYYIKVKEIIGQTLDRELFCTVKEAYKSFKLFNEDKLKDHPKKNDKATLSYNEYRMILIKYLPMLAGVDETQLDMVKESFKGRCLIKTMTKDLNNAISITFRLCEQIHKPRKKRTNVAEKSHRGKMYAYDSRFQMIHKLDDLTEMDSVIETFFEIFFGILEQDSYTSFLAKYRASSNNEALAEIKAIHAAKIEFLKV